MLHFTDLKDLASESYLITSGTQTLGLPPENDLASERYWYGYDVQNQLPAGWYCPQDWAHF